MDLKCWRFVRIGHIIYLSKRIFCSSDNYQTRNQLCRPKLAHVNVGVVSETMRLLGYERVYLPLGEVADKPFYIQGDEWLNCNPSSIMSNRETGGASSINIFTPKLIYRSQLSLVWNISHNTAAYFPSKQLPWLLPSGLTEQNVGDMQHFVTSTFPPSLSTIQTDIEPCCIRYDTRSISLRGCDEEIVEPYPANTRHSTNVGLMVGL